MKSVLLSWQLWALLSAAFAALTAIFAKVGVENVNSDFATFIRTVVILLALGAILVATRQWQAPSSVSGRSYLFLVLSAPLPRVAELGAAAATLAVGSPVPEDLWRTVLGTLVFGLAVLLVGVWRLEGKDF